MRVVIIGATGNIGTSLVQTLGADPEITSILGIARRVPEWRAAKTEWAGADVTRSDLVSLMRGADAVVHLAWLFQPTHRPTVTWETNVVGSARVFRAVAQAGVPVLVHSSSVGTYSPGPKDRPVAEDWPTHGLATAAYSREKAYAERLLDSFQTDHRECRVVRLRPGFIFKREAAVEQRRLFAGPLLPRRLVQPGTMPAIPDIPGMRFQALHAADAAEAFRAALKRDVRGPFNLAADPVVGTAELAELLAARIVRVPAAGVRAALAVMWRLGLVPASPALFDLVLRLPTMDCSRAREELGWSPAYDSMDALRAFLDGLRGNAGMRTPPLSPATSGPFRIRELVTGAGRRP